MGTTAVSKESAPSEQRVGKVDMKLEVVTLPVSDVDRSKRFYESLGWRLDADFSSEDDHVLQFTPPGSEASVHIGTHLTDAPAGSAQMFLIVSDAQAAREELLARGVEVSEIFHFAGWNRIAPNARVSGRGPGSYASFVSFNDPDGNTWLLQEITTRFPGRVAGDTTYSSSPELAKALWRAALAHGEHEKITR